ncbi:MAG: penicillin-binding protein [Acidobacteria bacterium]|nr:MAG: penicillin-binding protein [Acidobacteriota bacterium]
MKNDNSLAQRVYVLIAVMGFWAIVIGARLFFLHVVHSADYRQRAERQQQRTLEVSPRRGVIYDRNGNELAVSVKVDSVFAVPDEIEDLHATAKTLSPLVGVSKNDLIEKLDSPRSFVWVKRKVSAAQGAALRKAKLPGIYFQKEDMRYYPKRELASHVLGYVDIDEKGLGGLEYRYNDSIRGEAGRVLIMTDARGRSFNSIEQPVAPGANLVTTIDQNIQYIVEKEIAATAEKTHAKGISIIVMDPRTGEVLAMGNYPTFNPNQYAKYSPQAWINRALSHNYEPGSTFKIVTAASVFEEGLADPAELIDCQNGVITVFGRVIHDWKRFGLLSVKQIMQNSSDVGAIKLALRLGDERFADHIARLGFGKSTNVDLPGEEHGLARPASRWTKSSVGSIAMGQEISVTALQTVRMVSAVANGGILYQPYVVKRVQHPEKGILSETEPHGERAISAETAAKLQDMLEAVVTDGTAKSSKLDGYTAAGKTGTAQKIDETGRYSATKYVASFAGFAPAVNPAISMIVMIDEPVGAHHGGDVAAPVFKRIAEQVLRYMSLPPDVPSYAPQYVVKEPKRPAERTVKPATTASAQLVGLNVTTDFGDLIIPDFHGKSLRQVTEECLRAGLRLQSIGSGAAVEQLPPAGTSVRSGARVQVRFSSRVER